jgi:carbon-monoxide dehydrogenase medium subunit
LMDYLFRPKLFLRPQTLEEALSLLGDHGGSAKIIAGGTDLLVEKPGGVECLIDVNSLPLDYIKDDGEGLRIGALTTIESINGSEILTGPFHVLTEASNIFGHRNVRNLATIGGNLCSSVPSADMATPLMVLDSSVHIASLRGERTVPLEEFFVFVRENALEDDEMLIEVQVPPQPARTGTAFEKIGRTSVDIALVNVAVRLTLGEDDVCSDVRIALGSVSPTPMRSARAEGLLRGKGLDEALIDEAAQAASEEIKPISDVRSSAEYRRDASRVLTKRCMLRALERARGGPD